MPSLQPPHGWRASQPWARHWRALLIALLLTLGSGFLVRPAPAAAQEATPGAAVDFDGVDDYVTLPASLNDQFGANQITLEGWFYPTAPVADTQYAMWIGEEYTGDSNIKFTIYQAGSTITCGSYDAGWTAADNIAITLNAWQHVACTYDQQAIKVYINGALVKSVAATAPLPTGNGVWYLGRRWDADEFYTGRMDEIYIWNRALSASEIATGMNCELGSTLTGLVARYNFNQGVAGDNNSGVTSLSDGGGNYNGTLNNFALSGSASNWVAPGSAASGVVCAAAPEIDVQGNGVSIPSGNPSPSATDATDFGRQTTNNTVAHTFTINNIGAAALTNVAVTVTGASAFTLSATPASSVAAGDSTNFTLNFTPSAVGAYTATVHIASNDSDENPYTFVVLGVWTGSNVAVGKPATQSSTYPDDCTGPASKAVDGNTAGDPSACSFSTTNNEGPQDWWQVDLGAPYLIQAIDLWNRTDCCGERLSNFDLLVSTDGVNWTTFYYPGTAPTTTSFVINAVVRYVKVQLRGQDYLTLAEVQVWGPPLPAIAVQGNGVRIANGDTTPDSADSTAFGRTAVSSGTITRTFTIANNGTAALNLSGSPLVSLSGASAFRVTTQPASNSIAANDSTTFVVTFAPSAAGVVTATVRIANNDNAANPYTFAVQGEGMVPNVQLNGVPCDLIDAINAANSDAASGTCPAGRGADTITLLHDVALSTSDNINGGAYNALPAISSAITLAGGGHTLSRTGGAPGFRLFYVANNGTLILNQITLTGGAIPGLSNGGAIYNGGTLMVNNSTLTANTSNYDGGAIGNAAGGRLTVNNSTFSANAATTNYGGAIYNSGTVTMTNSTFSANAAGTGAGAILNAGTLTVNNCTVSRNIAYSGGGFINVAGGTLTLNRSLIAGNSATNNGPEIGISGGTVNANHYNLIGYGGSARSFGFTAGATDLVPSVALTQILTTTLANNGGGTQTHALVPGSPALNAAGGRGLIATDQRGVTRPQGSADDIGAFELEVAPEIDVQGNGVSIASGASTDFGSVDVSSGTVVRTFTIQNSGTAALTLHGTPRVAVSGANAGDFTVTQPAVNSVAAGGNTTFQITFDPSALGVRTALVTIANNDSDEGSYTFVTQGGGATKVTSQIAQLSFTKQSSTTTPDATYPTKSTAGVMVARLGMRNSGGNVNRIYFRVLTLNNGNWLLNADGAPGQVGSRLSVANSALPGGNNIWETNEPFAQDFRIGLMVAATMQLKVDLYAVTGVSAASADGTDSNGDELLGSYYIEVDPNDVAGAHIIYLPAVRK